MPGGGDPFGGGIQATDDGRGTHLPGAAEGTGSVQGVRGGDDYRIIDGEQDDKLWASGRGEMELENLIQGGRSANVPHGLPCQGKTAEMPGRGMPRTSGDKYRNAGTFYAPACPGHRDHFEGGKHPPPTMTPMRYAGPLAYTKRKSPCHRTVRHGGGSEEAAVSGGRIEGEHGEGI